MSAAGKVYDRILGSIPRQRGKFGKACEGWGDPQPPKGGYSNRRERKGRKG